MRPCAWGFLAAWLWGGAARADETSPLSRPDAGAARVNDEDAEVVANLELLQEMPTLENMELAETLTADDHNDEGTP
jgi:hypothetical protein